ncbi:hypothetical protein NQZ79_g51 [Umbelopsis isabellina]|nr:hypothetical protein NQZ79_g51 [Umbelopsis isabellina]
MTARAQHGPSLEEWEEKTRLSGLEQKSVFEINDSCAELPLPPELLRAISNSPISQIHSPAIEFPEIQIQSPPRSPPATSPRFPALPGARLAVQSSSLQRSLSTTQLLAESTAAEDNNAQKGAEAMGFDKPINNIQQFFDWFAKTELEMEQDQEDIYSRLAAQLAEGLTFFNHLEPISKKFNSANEDICTSPGFHAMLKQLDESIAYVEKHVQYRDSELYLMRFRQWSYIQVRQQLLSPIITAKIQELRPYNENILEFARNGCGYILNVCLEEFQLFYCFFDSGEEELYSYLELLTSYLYDYLRPRIIHENRIEILSELCNIFQLHIIRDLEGADVNKGHTLAFSYLVRNILQDTQSRLVFRAESYIHNDIERYNPTAADLDYPNVLQIERKSSIILSPPAADTKQAGARLNDPATLDVAEDSDGSVHEAADNNVASSSPTSTLASPPSKFTDNNASWFPPLQRTLWILSKLYRCVRTSVFEDLAQEAVSLCKGALISASESISNNQSKMDGQLFLIKHLLILKEQLAPFEANLIHAGKELDFSHVNVALSAFTKGRTSIFNPNALFDFAQSGIPRVVEISIDSRREIDRELKRICEDFILDSSQSATEPISNFITQVTAFQVANNMRTERLALSDQSFATPSSAYGAFEAFREAVNARLSFTMHRLGQYLDDAKMEAILLRPIQMNISSRYRQFYEIVSHQYDLETLPKQIPSTESMALWISQLVEEGKVLDDDL